LAQQTLPARTQFGLNVKKADPERTWADAVRTDRIIAVAIRRPLNIGRISNHFINSAVVWSERSFSVSHNGPFLSVEVDKPRSAPHASISDNRWARENVAIGAVL
jgi:hypothetical protein